MRRISDEDGFHAGVRNVGRWFLSMAPLALGLAASVWLGVWIQAHYFLIDRAQEQRRGSYVTRIALTRFRPTSTGYVLEA
jgi:hypothetical protein